MNFYRDFCLDRLKDVEVSLLDAADLFQVEDDDQLDAQQALLMMGKIRESANLAIDLLGTMAGGKVYKIGQTFQTIDAVDREDFLKDAEGVVDVVAAGNLETYANFNPAPIGTGEGFSHPAFPRVLSRVPIKNIYRLGPPGLFNGCLYRNCKQTLFACRTKGVPATTYLYAPTQDPLFCEPRELKLPPSFQGKSFEDVRIFGHRGSTLVSGGLARRTNSGWNCKIGLGEIGNERELVWAAEIDSPVNAPIEKNWVFFSHEGKLFCVYYPAPHVVYEINLHERKANLGQRWEAENWSAAKLMENARGGAPPVRVGDEFYHFYHSQHRSGYNVTYQTGLYTFETKPPWNLRRVLEGPLLNVVPSKREADVIFPMSAELENEKWHLACGIQDHETMAVTLDFYAVEQLLKPV